VLVKTSLRCPHASVNSVLRSFLEMLESFYKATCTILEELFVLLAMPQDPKAQNLRHWHSHL
jgi:hypothetical protein